MIARGPGWFVGLVSAGAAVGLLWAGRLAAGAWAYPLDDTYIHMAVARNLAENAAWGVNPGEFASASSAPAWTATLAMMFAGVGARAWVPLVLNLVALIGVFVVLDEWFAEAGARRGARVAGLFAVTAAAALPVVAGLGMEHVPHLLLTLLLARRIEHPGHVRSLLVLGALLPMVRYEALFQVAVAALVFAWRGRWGHAMAVAAGAALGVGAFGAWTLAHGAGFLPNSLLMKGALGHGFLANLRANLQEGTAAFVLVALVAVLLPAAGRFRDGGVLFVGTALLHLTFASVGWYYRYEAWLLAWGTAWVVCAVAGGLGRARVVAALGGLVFAGFAGTRTFDAVRYFDGRCVYIHDVKVALGEALAAASPGAVVALHDIGAVAFYGGGRIVDLAGLGTDEVARLSADRRFTGETIGEAVARRGATVAVATRSWMEADRPPGWTVVGELSWGLDAERRIEPIVVYALRPEGEAIARAWMTDAVGRMAGRGGYLPSG